MENLSYGEFMLYASDDVIDEFQSDEMRYGDGDMTTEQFYYCHDDWFSNLVSLKQIRRIKLKNIKLK